MDGITFGQREKVGILLHLWKSTSVQFKLWRALASLFDFASSVAAGYNYITVTQSLPAQVWSIIYPLLFLTTVQRAWLEIIPLPVVIYCVTV